MRCAQACCDIDMKVPATIRRVFEDQLAVNLRLKAQVDQLVEGKKDKRWHYESRVKALQSFALKLESGRVPQPGQMEDFFAAMLVVPNASEVARAEQLVRNTFDVHQRRPPEPGKTHKAPDAFPFDDLRLYLMVRPDPALPPSDLVGLVFELQIKTFLQHAWSIATHDLIYKTDEVSWSKERIAYQTKAMLEHAEVSIHEAERLAMAPALAMQDRRSTELQRLIALLKAQWDEAELPADIKRLAMNLSQIVNALDLQPDRLEAILVAGKASNGGAHPANLSPYATVVSYLLAQEQVAMRAALATGARAKLRVLIPNEIELPGGLTRADLPRAIFVD
jgi:ppGpp synthetase/RelA/SpoT-type nucleotidyltranferase